MLGILFRVGEQLCLARAIDLDVARAWARSGDGPQLGAAALEFHQGFGGRPNNGDVAESAVVHVGRRVDEAQRPVRLEGIELVATREASGQDQLIHIARCDVLLSAAYTAQEVATAERRCRCRVATFAHAVGKRTAQRADDLLPERAALHLASRVYEGDAASEVIEHEQGLRRDVVQRRYGAVRTRRQSLEESHYIVRRITYEPTSEWHAFDLGRRLGGAS